MSLLLHFYGTAFQALCGSWQAVVLHFVLAGAKDGFPDPKCSPLVKRWHCCSGQTGLKVHCCGRPSANSPESTSRLFGEPVSALHFAYLNQNSKGKKTPLRLQSIKPLFFQTGMNYIFTFAVSINVLIFYVTHSIYVQTCTNLLLKVCFKKLQSLKLLMSCLF